MFLVLFLCLFVFVVTNCGKMHITYIYHLNHVNMHSSVSTLTLLDSQSPECFYLAKPRLSISPFLQPLELPFYFVSLWISRPSKPHMSEIIQYLSFCDLLISPRTMVSMWNNQFVAYCQNFFPFLRLKNIPLHEYILYFLVHSFLDGHMSGFLSIIF